jgi:SAM-dependent methyltransferase
MRWPGPAGDADRMTTTIRGTTSAAAVRPDGPAGMAAGRVMTLPDGAAPARPTLLGALRGTILEIGPGPGFNLRYYAANVRWIGLEPNPRHRAQIWREASRLARPVQVLDGHAERIELPAGSVDAVVGTLVLCSVRDISGSLAEIRRILRPGGSYVFIEHVAAREGSWTRRAQDTYTLLTGRLGSACRMNLDTAALIERAGFSTAGLHRYTLPGPLGTCIPHIAGNAQ